MKIGPVHNVHVTYGCGPPSSGGVAICYVLPVRFVAFSLLITFASAGTKVPGSERSFCSVELSFPDDAICAHNWPYAVRRRLTRLLRRVGYVCPRRRQEPRLDESIVQGVSGRSLQCAAASSKIQVVMQHIQGESKK